MVGVLITLVFCVGAAGLGHAYVRRLLGDLDPALRLGVAGLLGLGGLGLITIAIGLVPSGLTWGIYAIGAFALLGLGLFARDRKVLFGKVVAPASLEWAFVGVLAIAFLFALVGVLAPSDMNDWDSLAYHLAVPKLWLQHGSVYPISFIHQSNFPGSIDALYIWGLTWGGQHGAKAFSLFISAFGTLAIFGITRQRYGRTAAWWAAMAFATIPVVLWESGTAYIDVGNGLYAGFGILFAALFLSDQPRPASLILSGICLGFAAGTKYTGLQTIFVVAAVILVVGLSRRSAGQGVKGALAVGLLGLAIASPWYIKNELWKGNPVFPFFYKQLGGKDWDQRRADIYTHEQQTFGAGRALATPEQPDITKNKLELTRIGHSVLGLAYQPGRYINPSQDFGGGTPLGAIGVAIVGALLLCLLAGARKPFEGSVLAMVVLSLAMWFVLSQQSRYIIALAVPLAVLLGGAAVRLRVGPMLAAITALQAIYSLWLSYVFLVEAQLPVAVGKVSEEEYLAPRLPFYEPSKAINRLGPNSKVALYDEVFGFLLDVPYTWANPGHSTEIPYDSMSNGHDYAAAMRKLGFTHVYLNLSPVVKSAQMRSRMLGEMGMSPGEPGFDPIVKQQMLDNFEQKYNILVADAVKSGELVPAEGFPDPQRPYAILFEIRPSAK